MENQKIELSNPYPIRLPINIVDDLKREAAKAQRSLSQELRFRIIDSWEKLPERLQIKD